MSNFQTLPRPEINPGELIVVDGLRGMGVSTQVQFLAAELTTPDIENPDGKDLDPLVTMGLQGSAFSNELQEFLVNNAAVIGPELRTLLHASQCLDQSQMIIEPALASGQHVISDTGWMGRVAHNAAESATGSKELTLNEARNIFIVSLDYKLYPSLFILLDAEPDEVKDRSIDPDDYLGLMKNKFHLLERSNLQELCHFLGGVIIDASQSIEAVSAEIKQSVSDRLNI